MPESFANFTHDEYTVGLICALAETELVAMRAMLDKKHPSLAVDPEDINSCFFGRMGHHNVIIACLPAETIGTASAAAVAKDMLRSFKAIRFSLMVGIGGGVPLEENTENSPSDSDSDPEDDTTRPWRHIVLSSRSDSPRSRQPIFCV